MDLSYNLKINSHRPVELAHHIIKTSDTVRATAKHFGVSKSTVHNDITQKLRKINHDLYMQVKQILDINKKERHIRGGNATKEKYLNIQKTN